MNCDRCSSPADAIITHKTLVSRVCSFHWTILVGHLNRNRIPFTAKEI